ncbi:MAG: hypothetical protein IJD60_12735, partial [Clostridia bacterium]|nr:hypothetical protein [Clostridia bacterium]
MLNLCQSLFHLFLREDHILQPDQFLFFLLLLQRQRILHLQKLFIRNLTGDIISQQLCLFLFDFLDLSDNPQPLGRSILLIECSFEDLNVFFHVRIDVKLCVLKKSKEHLL